MGNNSFIVPGRAGSLQCTCVTTTLVAVPTYLHRYIAVLMCTVAALGHATVWLHMSGFCHCEPAEYFSEVATVSTECGNCCSHQHDLPPDETSKVPSSPLSHDSGSCAICQSLACPIGSGWTQSELSITRDAQDRLQIHHSPLVVFRRLEKPRLRGPPMSAPSQHIV